MRCIILCFLHVAFLYTACKRENADPIIKEMSAVRGYKDWFIDSFRCGLFVPPSYSSNKSYPLIIRLHGYTDTTSWNLVWYNEPIVSDDPCIVLTPKCPKEEIYGWGDSFDPRNSPMMAKTYEMMAMVEKTFNLDKNRYYIYGSSMGGIGTYGVIQKNPDMFAAGYVECGYPNVEIAPIIAKIPFWIFHGSYDNVIPVQPTRNLYKAVLDQGGTQIRYTEYPGVGHNVWDYTKNETTLNTWLLAQRKGSIHSSPEPINFFTGVLSEENKVHLQWTIPVETIPPSDNNVWFCRIYRNGTVIKEVYNNYQACIDSSIVLNTTYEYKISVVNYYFKESGFSAPVTLTVSK